MLVEEMLAETGGVAQALLDALRTVKRERSRFRSDLAASAAVAVEGLTPPSEKRHRQQPHHISFVRSEVHDADTATVLRAVMLGYELLLATRAPHDVVMLDATLTLPVIYLNQALSKSREVPELQSSREFRL